MVSFLITEFLLLAIAIGVTLVLKLDLKEVFPIRIPKIKHIIGIVMIWMGGHLFVLLSTSILNLFFSIGMTKSAVDVSGLLKSVSFPIQILLFVLVAAICEEAFHRGIILKYTKLLKKNWLIVLIMSVLFGVGSLSLYRFLPAAILGALLTIVVIETNNFILPLLFHLGNNLFYIIKGLSPETAELNEFLVSKVDIYSIDTIQSSLIVYSIAPWLIFLGYYLVHTKAKKDHMGVKALIALISSVVMIGTGIGIASYNYSTYGLYPHEVVEYQNATVTVLDEKNQLALVEKSEKLEYEYEMKIEENGTYDVMLDLSIPSGIICFDIVNSNDIYVGSLATTGLSTTQSIKLKKDSYTVRITALKTLEATENYYREHNINMPDAKILKESIKSITDNMEASYDILIYK